MSWIRALAYAAVATCLVAGCKSQPTGVHITVYLKGGSYDELHFGVTDLVGDGGQPSTLVDPNTEGSKAGLGGAANPDVVVLLDDSVDGHDLLCDVAALLKGRPVGSDHKTLHARAHQIEDIGLYPMGEPGADGGSLDDAAVDANHAGSGGHGGETGGSGAGGGNGAGGMGTGGGNGSGGAGGVNGSGGNTGTGGANGSGGTTGAGGGAGGGSDAGGSGAGGANGSGGNSGAGGKTGTGAPGSPCTDGGQCASSFCADNVCCAEACTGPCTTCNFNQGTAGTCRAVMNKAPDPHHVCVDTGAGNCGTDGTCNKDGTCAVRVNITCTPACASETSRFDSGICGQTECVGLGLPIACPANMSSCVAGACQ